MLGLFGLSWRDWVSIVQLPLAIIALGLAVYELHRAGTIREATKRERQDTERRINEHTRLLNRSRLGEDLRRHLAQFVGALSAADARTALAALSEWVTSAAKLRGTVSADSRFAPVLERLDVSCEDVELISNGLRTSAADVVPESAWAQHGAMTGAMNALLEVEAQIDV